MTDANAQVPTCPGCHFGCSLDAYRCGRGKGFSEKWCAGEPIPERGMPPMMRDGEGARRGKDGGAPSASMRVMHGLNIMSNVLRDRHAESADRKVLGSVERQGGFFALSLIGKRTLIDKPQLDEAIDSLVAEGLAERVDDSVAGPILRITEAGRACQREWTAEHDAAIAEFLAPLTEEEQNQLADLIFRLISRRPLENVARKPARPR